MSYKSDLVKKSALETTKVLVGELSDNVLGGFSLGILSAAMSARNKQKADLLIEKLDKAEIKLTDELVQSDEFLGYTAKVLLAINIATKKSKMNYLLNIYTNGLADENFFQKSDRYTELVDIISSLSENSICLLVEIYKDFTFNGSNEEDSNSISRITSRLELSYDEFIATCYLLSGKGLIKQVPLANNGFVPIPSLWLKDIIHLLHFENNL